MSAQIGGGMLTRDSVPRSGPRGDANVNALVVNRQNNKALITAYELHEQRYQGECPISGLFIILKI